MTNLGDKLEISVLFCITCMKGFYLISQGTTGYRSATHTKLNWMSAVSFNVLFRFFLYFSNLYILTPQLFFYIKEIETSNWKKYENVRGVPCSGQKWVNREVMNCWERRQELHPSATPQQGWEFIFTEWCILLVYKYKYSAHSLQWSKHFSTCVFVKLLNIWHPQMLSVPALVKR